MQEMQNGGSRETENHVTLVGKATASCKEHSLRDKLTEPDKPCL